MSDKPATPGSFKKGDPRINRKGRPKSFDALRALALQIAHEAIIKNDEPLIISGHVVTVAEDIMRSWAKSKNPLLQRAFIEVAFGKVPDAIDLEAAVRVIVEYADNQTNPTGAAPGATSDQ